MRCEEDLPKSVQSKEMVPLYISMDKVISKGHLKII
jgi:hypothetical protein